MSAGQVQIVEVTSESQIPLVRELYQEYADWLGVDLCFQGFYDELRALPGVYARPNGFIYLANVNDKPAGCIALKPLSPTECEMKRLYVRPNFRRFGLGRSLVQLCLDEAKAIGYSKMRLDTLQRMQAAIALYKSFGFNECGEYYRNPLEDVVYMERALRAG